MPIQNAIYTERGWIIPPKGYQEPPIRKNSTVILIPLTNEVVGFDLLWYQLASDFSLPTDEEIFSLLTEISKDPHNRLSRLPLDLLKSIAQIAGEIQRREINTSVSFPRQELSYQAIPPKVRRRWKRGPKNPAPTTLNTNIYSFEWVMATPHFDFSTEGNEVLLFVYDQRNPPAFQQIQEIIDHWYRMTDSIFQGPLIIGLNGTSAREDIWRESHLAFFSHLCVDPISGEGVEDLLSFVVRSVPSRVPPSAPHNIREPLMHKVRRKPLIASSLLLSLCLTLLSFCCILWGSVQYSSIVLFVGIVGVFLFFCSLSICSALWCFEMSRNWLVRREYHPSSFFPSEYEGCY